MDIYYGVSADGRRVAEAETGGIAEAREFLAAAMTAGCELAWAHSPADLSALGFAQRPGYRRLTGPAGAAPRPAGVSELLAGEDTAELCAAAYRGQWGHKTPDTWPPPELAGSRLLGLRRGELITGICRVFPETGCIDAPGLIAGQDGQDGDGQDGYRMLLAAALSQIMAGPATVESWGDEPGRVAVCERLGLATTEYCPGWELDLIGQIRGQLAGK